MSDSNPVHDGKRKTRLTVGEQSIRITLADVEQMRAALASYLKNNTAQIASSAPAGTVEGIEKTAGQGWIDRSGVVHVGLWVLSGRSDGTVLLYRPLPPGTYQFEAKLHRGEEGSWSVQSVRFASILLRR